MHGNGSLKGAINISGSKNASLPILAATLLSNEPSIVRRVPDVSDTNYMLQILRALGAEVERSSGTVRVEPADISPEAPYDLVRKMRASICVMGPLLARVGRAKISLPGGCVIGDRPVDLHLKAMQGLGARIEMEGGDIMLSAPEGLLGSEIDMRGKHGPTVLGTDNLMMAAVLAKGTTVIDSAASEPEVVDLADFLVKMGARIKGAGTRRIVIEGVEELKGVEHTIIPDRIEAGTFMVAGAMAGQGVTLRRVCRRHLEAATEKLEEAGHVVTFNETGTEVAISPGETPRGCDITTAPYPGFPTDMQAQFTAMFATTPGISVVEDTIFPHALHALLGNEAHGGRHQSRRRTGAGARGPASQCGTGHGLGPSGLGGPRSGCSQGRRNHRNQPPLPYRPGIRAYRRQTAATWWTGGAGAGLTLPPGRCSALAAAS